MRINQFGFLLLSFSVTQSCGFSFDGENSDSSKKETEGNSSTGKSKEEMAVFFESGKNSLGVGAGDFDHAIVVGNPTVDPAIPLVAFALEDDETDSDASRGRTKETQPVASMNSGKDQIKETTKEKEIKEASEEEIKVCSDHFGQPVSGLKLSGNKTTSTVESGKFIAVKLSGNQTSINILLTSAQSAKDSIQASVSSETAPPAKLLDDAAATTTASGTPAPATTTPPVAETAASTGTEDDTNTVKGICIVASGNRPLVNVVIDDVIVEKVYYVASGNLPKAQFEVKKDSEIEELTGEIKGNGGQVLVTGEGKYSCDKITVKGSSEAPVCGSEAAAVAQESTAAQTRIEKAKKPEPAKKQNVPQEKGTENKKKK